MAETSLLSVRNLHVSYPDMTNKPLFGRAPQVDVLHGVTVDIKPGEILGIVGESGSGKSTLGRAMLRLLEPRSGTISFAGTDITHVDETALRPLRHRFQMIFQDPMSSLNPRCTIGAIIAAPVALHAGSIEAEKCAAEALDRVGLPGDFAGRFPHQLSGGQRQRVGIARAIALRPDFILADEIVSGLDMSSQATVLTLLKSLVGELGLTLAFISHDLSVIRLLCDTTIVMQQGRIVETGATADLFDDPKSPYTRELLDAIPLAEIDQEW